MNSARSRARLTPYAYATLREEIEAALDLTLYELYNRWVPDDRRELWKSIYGRDDFSWWGNCDGAAAAAILEKLPAGNIELSGIKFTPSDFQHYYTMAYNAPMSLEWVGRRTDVNAEHIKRMEELLAKPDSATYLEDLRKLYKEAYYEEEAPEDWGGMYFEILFRSEIEAYKDISVTDFHSWLERTIGEGKAVVFDRRTGRVVWNYVASGYEFEVMKAGSKEVNGETVDVYSVTAKISYGDYHDYTWDGSDGVYTYELYVKDGRIVGGTWTGGSVDDHPDFAWRPKESIADSGLLDDLRRWQRRADFLEWWVGMLLRRGGNGDLIERLKLRDYLYLMGELKKRGATHAVAKAVEHLRSAEATVHYVRLYRDALAIQGKVVPTRGVTETLEGALGDGGR